MDLEEGFPRTAILSVQDDFRRTCSRLPETMKDSGHISLPCTKLHCEIKWIEYY